MKEGQGLAEFLYALPLLQAAIEFLETGSFSQATVSRQTAKSRLLLSVPPYTHTWDGGSRLRLQ